MTIRRVNNHRKSVSELDWEEIGNRLRELRGVLTQTQFGDQLGVPQNIVSRYERASVRPPIEYLVLAARHRGVTLDWLLLGKKRTPR